MDLVFNLNEGRFGMRLPPLFDLGQILFTLFDPSLLVHLCFLFPFFLKMEPSYQLLFCPAIPLQKCKGHSGSSKALPVLPIRAILQPYD